MSEIKVKNKGNPVYIGKVLCNRGTITSVKKQDYIDFCKTPSGKALHNNSFFIVDGNIKKQQDAERDALQSQIEAKVRQELGPVIEREIGLKLEKEYGKRIDDLKADIDSKDVEIRDLENRIDELQKDSVGSDTTKNDDVAAAGNEEFIFNPEEHIIEHRGAGKYFIMDTDDKKLYGPLTDEEKATFEEMQKEA